MNSIKTRCHSLASMLAATSIVLCWAAVGAHAAEQTDALTKHVSFGELNLNSAAGAKVLYSRLRHAAETVCAPLDGRELSQNSHYQACYASAMSSAVIEINKSMVTALHNDAMNHQAKG